MIDEREDVAFWSRSSNHYRLLVEKGDSKGILVTDHARENLEPRFMEEGERFHERQDRIKENGNFFFRFTVSDRLPANSPFETVPIRRKKTSARTIFVFVLFCSADIRETILKNVSETKKKGESFLPFVFYFYLSILIGLLYLNVSPKWWNEAG